MGPWGCFGVKLDREEWHFKVPEASHGVIVEMHMGHFATSSLQTGLIDAKTVILTGDLDSLPDQIGNWLIRPSVSEG